MRQMKSAQQTCLKSRVLFPHPHDLLDDGSHVVILVFGETAPEDDTWRELGGLRPVAVGQGVVVGVVDRIVGFHARQPLRAVLATDDRVGIIVDPLAEHLEMLVLDDARIGHGGISVVDHCVSLVVGHRLHLRLEAHGAEVEVSMLKAEELVELSRVDDSPGLSLPVVTVGEEVRLRACLHALKQSVHESVVSALGDALVAVVEVVVVVYHPDRKSFDDEGRQVGASAPPLLLRVALDEPFIDVASDERQGLLLQIARLYYTLGPHLREGLCALLRNLDRRLLGRHRPPHLEERVHVERQIVEPSLVVGHRRVGISVEGHDTVHEVPHPFVGRMENVCAILVHMDSLHILTVDVAAQVGPLVDHQATLAVPSGEVGKGGAKEAGAHDQVVVRVRHRHTITRFARQRATASPRACIDIG